MGRSLSPKDIEFEFVNSFPNNSGRLAAELWQDVSNLRYHWSLFESFFASSEDKTNTFAKVSIQFFLTVHNLLINSMKLQICKLSDPAFSRNFENASIKMLFKKVEDYLSIEAKKDILFKLEKLEKKVKPVRNFRDKLIAHSDLPTKLDTRITPLEPVLFSDLKSIIHMIEQIMNAFEVSFSLEATPYHLMNNSSEANYLYKIFKSHLDNEKT